MEEISSDILINALTQDLKGQAYECAYSFMSGVNLNLFNVILFNLFVNLKIDLKIIQKKIII